MEYINFSSDAADAHSELIFALGVRSPYIYDWLDDDCEDHSCAIAIQMLVESHLTWLYDYSKPIIYIMK